MNVRSFYHKISSALSSSSNSASRDLEKIAAREQKHFSYKTLSRATDKFNANRKLGEGGFGPVYRGKLEDGREIAVKKLSQTSKQGKKEFLNEARLLLRVQHRNVVNLLGYCARGEDKLLVYEYVPHESLDKLLFKPGKKEELDWKKRYDIILGIAKGLHYLHEDAHSCIIHRDIKASNILLDDKWAPKIADFGMARLFPKDETHVNTGIAGTSGYMAPEYIMNGQLTVKADVFSFGVLILELVSGRKNSSVNMSPDVDNLLSWDKGIKSIEEVTWAYKMFQKGRGLEIMDPTLAPTTTTTTTAEDQVALCIHIGLLCVQSDPSLRPTMERVEVMLTKRPTNLEGPTRPGNTNVRVYHRSSRPTSSSSNATTSAASSTSGSQFTNTSSTANTASVASNATTSTSSASRSSGSGLVDRRGKRPMEP